jgi:hypothetical protein
MQARRYQLREDLFFRLGGFLLFRGGFARRHTARDIRESFLEGFLCRHLLFSAAIMPVLVLAVAGPAHYLHNLFTDHGNDGVIGGSLAAGAMIVDVISKAHPKTSAKGRV